MSLRDDLDSIDGATLANGGGPYWKALYLKALGAWIKGCVVAKAYPAILEYQGGRGRPGKDTPSIISWSYLKKETGRPRQTIQRWVRLVKQVTANGKPSPSGNVFKAYMDQRHDEFMAALQAKIRGDLPSPETVEKPTREEEEGSAEENADQRLFRKCLDTLEELLQFMAAKQLSGDVIHRAQALLQVLDARCR
jgi:hypothetical protein